MENSKKEELKYRAFRFSITIIKFVETFPNKRVYWIIADQLLRAATSIGANIIEAQASSSRKDFIKFFEISLKSANETMYWICILREISEPEKTKEINDLLDETKSLANISGASLLTLKGKKKL